MIEHDASYKTPPLYAHCHSELTPSKVDFMVDWPKMASPKGHEMESWTPEQCK